MNSFNAQKELEQVHSIRASKRKKFRQSKLKVYKEQLLQLREAGASYQDLAQWLSSKKKMKVSYTTIMRYLKKISKEENDPNHV